MLQEPLITAFPNGSGAPTRGLSAFTLPRVNNDNGLDLSGTVYLPADESLCKWMHLKSGSGRMDSKQTVVVASYVL